MRPHRANLLPVQRGASARQCVHSAGMASAASVSVVEECLQSLNPGALFLAPRTVFDAALVGITTSPKDHWPRRRGVAVALYDTDACHAAIRKWLECSDEEAAEWFSYNTSGAWMGEGTPAFR